jgi:hypothetical protein
MRIAAFFGRPLFAGVGDAIPGFSGDGSAVASPGVLVPEARPLPEPPGGWRTNMPTLPGGPIALPGPIAGAVEPIEGEFHILPYPMPDTAPGEATILPFPLPGSPVSFTSWGAWIGL